MNTKKMIRIAVWIVAWVLIIAFIRWGGYKGFAGFIIGSCVATVLSMMVALKYNTQFFMAAQAFTDTILKPSPKKSEGKKKIGENP